MFYTLTEKNLHPAIFLHICAVLQAQLHLFTAAASLILMALPFLVCTAFQRVHILALLSTDKKWEAACKAKKEKQLHKNIFSKLPTS